MIKKTFLTIGLLFAGSLMADVTVVSMAASRHSPRDGKADIEVVFGGCSNEVADAQCLFMVTNTAERTTSRVTHITSVDGAAGSGTTWTRRFVWNYDADIVAEDTDEVDLVITVRPSGCVQLWEDGPLWAECNLGAGSPEQSGYYFWWGDTVGYGANTNNATLSDSGTYWRDVEWVSSAGEEMSWCPFDYSRCPTYDKSYDDLVNGGYIDSSAHLNAEHDAATAHLGVQWRLPTKEEFSSLVEQCDLTVVISNGVQGLLITGRDAYESKSVFLPAAGYGELLKKTSTLHLEAKGRYWSSVSTVGLQTHADSLCFDGEGTCTVGGFYRQLGQPIRPVAVEFSAMAHLTGLMYVATSEPAGYLDYDANDGRFTNAVRVCKLVTARTRTLESGWHAVVNPVVIENGANIRVSGDAHLILCDGGSLTIRSVDDCNAAMEVMSSEDDGTASLAIYGQDGETGRLDVSGGFLGSGIGGSYREHGGGVTINGGTVTARGGGSGAGIGGGCYGYGGTMTINGGTVTVWGGISAAGVGGGHYGGCGTVTINGGTVTAWCGFSAAGIGGGYEGGGGTVTINGGAVRATGDEEAESIGSGMDGEAISVRVSGGVFEEEPQVGWLMPGCSVVENPDEATKAGYPWAVLSSCVVSVGALTHMTAAWTSGDGAVTNVIEGADFEVLEGTKNVKIIFAAEPGYVLEGEATVCLDTVTEDIVLGEGGECAVPRAYCSFGDVPYLDWNGSQMTNAVLSKYGYTLVTDDTLRMTSGWYVVAQDVAVKGLTVTGEVNLVIMDGFRLDSRSASEPGVKVLKRNSLTVYGQALGTGRLTAEGASRSAGIGGRHHAPGGSVTINGGKVTAKGDTDAAGIGGGSNGAGGSVTINGGKVEATGGMNAAGIGGGYMGSGGSVTIRGGAVNAKGGSVAVGPGSDGRGGTVSISGGLFSFDLEKRWIASECVKIENPDEKTKVVYKWKVVPLRTVAIGAHPNVAVAWTSGDGSETNDVDDTCFGVVDGTENVKVIFSADPGWEIVGENVVDLGTVTSGIAFGAESGYLVPEVKITDPCTITFGRNANMSIEWTSGIGLVVNAVTNGESSLQVPRGSDNVRITCTANPGYELVGQSVFEFAKVTTDIEFGRAPYASYVLPSAVDSVKNIVYPDWDEVDWRMTNAVARTDLKKWTAVTDATRILKGCMVVTNDVTVSSLTVSQSAVLVLSNEATLNVTGEVDRAGIHVPGGSFLTITVRMGSTGRVVVQGGANCAGIGSQLAQGAGSVLGAVKIVAGEVSATGGRNASGIGNGNYGNGGGVKIFGGRVTANGGLGAKEIGDGANPVSPCAVSISGGVFAHKPEDGWLMPGFTAVENLDETTNTVYPWTIADDRPVVSPGATLGPFDTAAEATNAMAAAVLAPSVEVSDALVTDMERAKYCKMFELGVVPTSDGKWSVSAALSPEDWTNVVESANAATLQLPVAEIAALAPGTPTDVVVEGCVPGFYYTLYGSPGVRSLPLGDVRALPTTEMKYGPTLCGVEGKVMFFEVWKPSDTAGFFTVGVSVTEE